MTQYTSSPDHILPFSIAQAKLRGRMVRLEQTISTILRQHTYPEPVALLLAELSVLGALFGHLTLKQAGKITLQTQTQGAVQRLIVDYHHDGKIRAYASMDPEALGALLSATSSPTLSQLVGEGSLAMTVWFEAHAQPYQALVPLSGNTLAECMSDYCIRSEQLPTLIKVAVARTAAPHSWMATGLMIQSMPLAGEELYNAAQDQLQNEREKLWHEAQLFLGTVTEEELLDETLPEKTLLMRLFHELEVTVYDEQPIHHECTCSRERAHALLSGIDPTECAELTDNGEWVVTCQFCNKGERFTEEDLE